MNSKIKTEDIEVITFDEKIKAKTGEFINAGIYLLAKEVFLLFPLIKKFR